MLPAAARLRHREDFALAVRRGRRARRSSLVVHYLGAPGGDPASLCPARVGFVVGRPVGNSVERHRVVRRLRHLARERLVRLPAGSRLVVRALPPSAGSGSAGLARDFDAALDRVLGTAP
ncbi:MAG TPA: ribonuclease P protein component [Mycobacteriales bacterium]|nr:ribonuclease P protein component [Mycobacteriales bacterium]